MKIVVAADSFKGTMDSIEVCSIIGNAIKDFDNRIDVVTVPIADGGEGTVDAFLHAVGGERVFTNVKDPLMRDVRAYYGILQDKKTAIIETAQASGIGRIENELSPMTASTFGTGQLIRSALDNGCSRIIIGLGGSATTDAGVGAAHALGVRFLTKDGMPIPVGGEGLRHVSDIDTKNIDKRIFQTEIVLACDVENCLFGPNGAAFVYAPQKGATPDQVKQLDDNLRYFAEIIEEKLDIDVSNIMGGGAAGGLSASLIAFAGAKIVKGIDAVLELVGLNKIILDADLIITGEGRIDSQTIMGKVPVGVARVAMNFNVPVIAIGGSFGEGYEKVYDRGICCAFSVLNDFVQLKDIKQSSKNDLYMLVKNLMKFAYCFPK
jgi:glycerate kinase